MVLTEKIFDNISMLFYGSNLDDDDELKFNDASTHGVILRLEGYTAL